MMTIQQHIRFSIYTGAGLGLLLGFILVLFGDMRHGGGVALFIGVSLFSGWMGYVCATMEHQILNKSEAVEGDGGGSGTSMNLEGYMDIPDPSIRRGF